MGDVQENIDDASLQFIINHVFVPPKLPQQPEVDGGLHTSILLDLCVNFAQQYQEQKLHSPEMLQAWEAVLKMLKSFSALDNPNSLDAKAFEKEVQSMQDGDVLALHIDAQNAGLILQATPTEIIFQSFEVSPLSAEVLKPVGKLRCSYPGPAIAVSLQKVFQEEFLRELSSFLEKIKRDTTLAPDVHSRGTSNVAEERESAHPMFITELLFGILRGIGKPATVNRFEKRVGDEVLWERARVPWRRSPLWLTVKIALQMTIMIRAGVAEYKLFMIYLIAGILKIAVERDDVASDILFSMNAKLVGRVGKFAGTKPGHGEREALQRQPNRVRVLEIARTVSESCVRVLEMRWQETIRNNKQHSSWAFHSLMPTHDTSLSMTNSWPYIEQARTWGLSHVPSRNLKVFRPKEPQRLQHLQTPWTLPTSAVLTEVFAETTGSNSLTKDCALADIEKWIACDLVEWTMVTASQSKHLIEEQCEHLGDLVHTYMEFGKVEYEHNPERMSLFYLTMMEMWVAMDILALKCYPILADYPPSYFTEGFLHPLLLPLPSQRIRLENVESYLSTRKTNAQLFASNDGIFSGVPTKNAFSVRYFDLEPSYAALRETILENAEVRKEKKDRELRKKIQEQMKLKEKAHKMSCQFYIHPKDGTRRHQRRCQKCLRIGEAERMTVEVFEWPLPDDDLKSKAVVFELQCPRGFSVWRDVTYHVLQQVSMPQNNIPLPTSKKARKAATVALPFEYLDNFSELCQYYETNRQLTSQQVHWASSTKSFLSSHYRFHRLPTDLNSVCVRNNLNFGFFDKSTQRWIRKGIMRDCNIQSQCTFKIPSGPYKALQFALDYDLCSPNEAIARQAACPPEIQLNEFLAFSLVRSGHVIQWLNIIRELKTRTLTFSSEAVNMLFMSCAWQAGPPGDYSGVYRETHTHFKEGQFVRKLLEEMNVMLVDIKSNWQEAVTVKTLIALGTQLLMLYDTEQHDPSFQQQIVAFLKQARAVCLDWVRELATALHECDDSQETRKLQSRVVHIATICRGTYDVEVYLLPLLLATEADVAELIECATLIHDNLSISSIETMPLPLRMLFERDRRLAHKLENYLRGLIVDTGVKVDLSRVWSGGSYESDLYTWTAVGNPSERWIKGAMSKAGQEGQEIASPQTVHYNLLTGRLLVDGKPLGRLPPEYLAHPVYQELFGEKLLIVFPAPSPMDFATKHPIFNHWVFFAMDQDELIIRTRPTTGPERYHLIPKSKLKGDFPAHITEKYVFWLSLITRRIELRLRSKPMQRNYRRDSEPWTHYPYITSLLDGHTLHLVKSAFEKLIDVRTDTARMIHRVFSPLEYDSHIDVTLKQYKTATQPVVEVNLPRLKLSFFVNDQGQLRCRQFLNMNVDLNQNLSTFIGLENKLVVRQGSLRSVIIPYGNVTVRSDERHHVVVQIGTRPSGFDRVRYHIYTIDETLGRLVGNGSLANHLYKVYLHAVTSSCMPDPLTNATGTETALALLRSAATWSFQRLENDVETNILRQIASLSPQRVFYPKHLRCMQQVTWNQTLSPLSQHESFNLIVQDVFSYAASLRIFTDGNEELESVLSEPHLAKRAAFRNSRIRRDEFLLPVEKSPGKSKADLQYIARDRHSSPEEAKVHYVAQLVGLWPRRFVVCSDLLHNFIQWGTVDGQPVEELGYDEKLLDTRISDIWFDLQRTFLYSSREDGMFPIMFTLATLAFKGSEREGLPLPLIGTLLAFATVPKIKKLQMPTSLCYDLSAGFEPEEKKLLEVVNRYVVEFALSNEAKLRALPQETAEELASRRAREYAANVKNQVSACVRRLIAEWSLTHKVPTISQWEYPLISVNDFVMSIGQLFSTWYDNMMLKGYVDRLQHILDHVNVTTNIMPEIYTFTPYEPDSRQPDPVPLYEELFNRRPSRFSNSYQVPPAAGFTPANHRSEVQTPQSQIIMQDLYILLAHFSEGTHQVETKKNPKAYRNHDFIQRYAKDLMNSLRALGRTKAKSTMKGLTWDVWSEQWKPQLKNYRNMCSKYLNTISNDIENALVPSSENYGSWMMYRAGLWPQTCRRALLQRLAASTFATLPSEWKYILVQLGTAMTMLQRAERLLRMGKSQVEGGGSDLIREIENTGHQAWDPLEHPDWLLMEIESNILIRPVQAEVATTMTTPPEEKNTIMQLLMGEGKTSIIVPIVAASLADGGKLVRVIVLKPLCGQMFQMLVQRLGGLVNRRVFYMPFSRKINLNFAQVRKLRLIMEECQSTGGVLVVQPEHILSFKLLGLEHLFNAQTAKHTPRQRQDIDAKEQMLVARELIDMQHWLEGNARDILDESDEILNTRHELIYTIGNPKPIEHHPQRWLVVQEVLSLMALTLKDMKFEPTAFEIDPRGAENGEFNSIRILDQSQGEVLLDEVARRIVDSQLSLISFRHWPPSKRALGIRFITDDRLEYNEISGLTTGDSNIDGILLLLRGLIAYKILMFTLHEKRWKVDYGLDLKRSMLAVPYRAKDSPSGQSEFSHPDVAITLTCLSYYYGGLLENQLEIAFRAMLKTDNPTLEYEKWWKVMTTSKHPELRHLNAINLEDTKQWSDKIVPMFSFNKAVIDFYLSRVVFPLEAKEFEHKLSSSGWDIAEKKQNPTTGFSGTNDNKYLLPQSIQQYDTPQQLNTNASVLSYLLASTNFYIPVQQQNGTRLGTEELLNRLNSIQGDHDVRVLLDVGAQVLEWSNEQVASNWLSMSSTHHSIKAAVYFNDDDQLTIMTKDGVQEPLMISAFADRLDHCLVYLDEAHTRGTDLKLPPNCRAAVTLGPNLTKDRLVQACMRMRKLGSGHSVVFCGPPEIDRELRALARVQNRRTIGVSDVIQWSMEQTCSNTSKMVSIWVKQGVSHRQRSLATKDIMGNSSLRFPKGLLEKEAKTLDQHYGLERAQNTSLCPPEMSRDPGIKAILDYARTNFGVERSSGAPLLEEQERELCHEIEIERENQRPPPAQASQHEVSIQLLDFIANGKLPAKKKIRENFFIPAFDILSQTAAGKYLERAAWPKNLLLTKDCSNTIIKRQNAGLDDYLMPVNWVLSSSMDPEILVILNPWEVNACMPDILFSTKVTLHMYSPRTTKASPSYDHLDYYTLPHPLSSQPNFISTHQQAIDLLGLFSGQSYFHDYAAYERICGFLGLYLKNVPEGSANDFSISPDGYVNKKHRSMLKMPNSPFDKNPLPLLRVLMGLRRKGQSYLGTHVGCMLHGRQLRVEDVD